MTLENLTKYQAGGLAYSLAQSKEGAMYIGGALEQLASDIGIKDEAKGFIDGAMASEKGIKTAISTYSEKYQHALESASINELLTHYGGTLNDYLDEKEVTKIKSEFGKFSNENFGEINKKLKKSQYILEGKESDYEFSDKEKQDAKNTIEKYKNIMMIVNMLENDKFEKLRPDVAERTHKQSLKGIVEKL